MRLVFIGASGFGWRCLQKILALPCCEVVGIITNPSTFSISYRPEGVTNVLHVDFAPLAEKYGIPLSVMDGKMSDPKELEAIKVWKPDFILVVGWYHMVPRTIRTLAPTAGLHSSLLPDYSGGAPLVWAMLNGEEKTGISFFMLGDGVDDGDLIGQKNEPIYLNDTIATLYARIEQRGIELLQECLPKFANGQCQLTVQDGSRRRIMPQRSPEDGRINWDWRSLRVYNFIRAQTKPYPGAFTYRGGEKLTIWEAKFFDYLPYAPDMEGKPPQAGQVLALIDEGLLQGILVQTSHGDHPILLAVVGCEGAEMISGVYYAKQKDIKVGEVFD